MEVEAEALSEDKEEEEEDAEEELCKGSRERGPGTQVLEEEEDTTSIRVKRPARVQRDQLMRVTRPTNAYNETYQCIYLKKT